MTLRRFACLVFRASSDKISSDADELLIEVVGGDESTISREILQNAAAAVLHYYRVEKGMTSIPLHEFAEAMVLVLRGLGFDVRCENEGPSSIRIVEADLERIAAECGIELAFFIRLRGELASHLKDPPDVIRFTGLRGCVKLLSGARRWGRRCQTLNDQIVEYMRDCFSHSPNNTNCAMVIE